MLSFNYYLEFKGFCKAVLRISLLSLALLQVFQAHSQFTLQATSPTYYRTCTGQTHTHAVAVIGTPAFPLTFTWKRNGTVVSTASGLDSLNSFTTALNSGGNYCVSVKDANDSVSNEFCFQSVFVAPPTVSTVSAPASLCTGSTGTLTFRINNFRLGHDYTYVLYRNGTVFAEDSLFAVVGGQETKSYTVPAGNYNFVAHNTYLGVTCTGNRAHNIIELPQAMLSLSTALPNRLCAGDFTGGSINATATGGTAPYIFEWKKGTTVVGNASTLNITQGGTYCATVTGQTCPVTPVCHSVTVVGEPTIVLNASADQLCHGDSVTLTAQINNFRLGHDYTYVWKLNGIIISEIFLPEVVAGQNTATFVATQAGNYTFAAANTFAGVTCSAEKEKMITSPMSVSLTSTFDVQEDGKQRPNIFETNLTGGVPPYNYLWQRDGELLGEGMNLNQYNTSTFGKISVTVTDSQGCKAHALKKVYIVFEDDMHEEMEARALLYNQVEYEDYEQKTYEYMKIARHADEGKISGKYKIPVVFHRIHVNTWGDLNLSNSDINEAIARLNRRFNGLETGLQSRTDGFGNNLPGANIEIEFCLAGVADKIGGSVSSNHSIDQQLQLKTQIAPAVDQNRFMNIWVVKNFPGGNGYSTTPTFPLNIQGVVLNAFVFDEWYATFEHEIGHFLGLDHVFHTADKNDNCLLDGDKICDTPPADKNKPKTCDYNRNTFSTDTDDKDAVNNPFTADMNDMFNNYMDYTTGSCRNAFTDDQKDRIIHTLVRYKPGLVARPKMLVNGTDLLQNNNRVVVCGVNAFLSIDSYNYNLYSSGWKVIREGNSIPICENINCRSINLLQGVPLSPGQEAKFTISANGGACGAGFNEEIILVGSHNGSVSLTNTPLCPNTTATFEVNGAVQGSTYSWSVPNGLRKIGYESGKKLTVYVEPGFNGGIIRATNSGCKFGEFAEKTLNIGLVTAKSKSAPVYGGYCLGQDIEFTYTFSNNDVSSVNLNMNIPLPKEFEFVSGADFNYSASTISLNKTIAEGQIAKSYSFKVKIKKEYKDGGNVYMNAGVNYNYTGLSTCNSGLFTLEDIIYVLPVPSPEFKVTSLCGESTIEVSNFSPVSSYNWSYKKDGGPIQNILNQNRITFGTGTFSNISVTAYSCATPSVPIITKTYADNGGVVTSTAAAAISTVNVSLKNGFTNIATIDNYTPCTNYVWQSYDCNTPMIQSFDYTELSFNNGYYIVNPGPDDLMLYKSFVMYGDGISGPATGKKVYSTGIFDNKWSVPFSYNLKFNKQYLYPIYYNEYDSYSVKFISGQSTEKEYTIPSTHTCARAVSLDSKGNIIVSNTIQIPLPCTKPLINITPPSACEEVITLNANGSINGVPLTTGYTWTLENSEISTQQNINISTPGNYCVSVQSGGCASDAACINVLKVPSTSTSSLIDCSTGIGGVMLTVEDENFNKKVDYCYGLSGGTKICKTSFSDNNRQMDLTISELGTYEVEMSPVVGSGETCLSRTETIDLSGGAFLATLNASNCLNPTGITTITVNHNPIYKNTFGYKYVLAGPAGFTEVTQYNANPFNTQWMYNLPANAPVGTYSVTVSENKSGGCTPQVLTHVFNNPTLSGPTPGSVCAGPTLAVSNGSGTYIWSRGDYSVSSASRIGADWGNYISFFGNENLYSELQVGSKLILQNVTAATGSNTVAGLNATLPRTFTVKSLIPYYYHVEVEEDFTGFDAGYEGEETFSMTVRMQLSYTGAALTNITVPGNYYAEQNGCSSAAKAVTITPKTDAISLTKDDVTCGYPTLTVTPHTAGNTYRWYADGAVMPPVEANIYTGINTSGTYRAELVGGICATPDVAVTVNPEDTKTQIVSMGNFLGCGIESINITRYCNVAGTQYLFRKPKAVTEVGFIGEMSDASVRINFATGWFSDVKPGDILYITGLAGVTENRSQLLNHVLVITGIADDGSYIVDGTQIFTYPAYGGVEFIIGRKLTSGQATVNNIIYEGRYDVGDANRTPVQLSNELDIDIHPCGLDFDGSDDFVNVPSITFANDMTNGPLTLEARVNLAETGNPIEALLSFPGGPDNGVLTFGYERDNSSLFLAYSGGEGSEEYYTFKGASVTLSEDLSCAHLAVTRASDGKVTFYVNGFPYYPLQGYDYLSNTPVGSTMQIGQSDGGYYRYNFTGTLSNIRIWNTERSQELLEAYQDKSLLGTEPGLLAYYQFLEGGGQDLFSTVSSDHNSGTLGPDGGLGQLEDPDWVTENPHVNCNNVARKGEVEEELLSGNEIKLYPNPFSDGFNLEVYDTESETYSFELYNLHGVRVMEKVGLPVGGIHSEPGTSLSAGVYLLKVQTGSKVGTLRLVKLQ